MIVSTAPKSHNKAAAVYFDHLQKTNKSYSVEDPLLNFKKLFKDLKLGANEKTIRQIYAQNIYFNDTLKVINNVDDLIPYMVGTADLTRSTKVEVLDVAFSGTDYYIRWVMKMDFEAKGKDIYSESIGMTQLRFNEKGKIIFHQDFWDSTEGFYQHLPYIGYIIRKVRSNI